ncbi:tumor necrosis factor ligand superfamily member 13B-like isoform X2 [Scyliorhinus canicula]|uniref:tumor necrosis factor ligand superfamily member 13B-like isoform X2 n=1 Tax=Scyliorhinus canicula TaxID=7830 RepID=UPI0018F41DEC|nr:tumor necrosis factor ligand superfamily member 13B-like isoform X2 [Scyliorhinus canicula]
MQPKCWTKLPESRSRCTSRGLIGTMVILFLAVLCCLSLLVILLQQISDLRSELAKVHKQLDVFNKRGIINPADNPVGHERETENQSENLKKNNNVKFQIKEQKTGVNEKNYDLRSISRKKRDVRPCEKQRSFLQLIPNAKQSIILQDDSTFIPWIVASRRGEALEATSNKIVVKENGYYTVYSQVLYYDNCMAMGHVVQRRKANVVGDERRIMTLFRCIQNMPNNTASNTCFTAGIVKLDQEDELELLLPSRPNANISMDKDSTFFGAIQLL